MTVHVTTRWAEANLLHGDPVIRMQILFMNGADSYKSS